MPDAFEIFLEQLLSTSWLEAVAVITGLLSVWYSKQENILVYPFGIISVLIYVYITFNYRLYADMGINSYYFVMSVYGWYHWTDYKDGPQIPITRCYRVEYGIAFSLLLISFLIIRFSLDFTDSDVPTLDSTTTSFAISAMWLMARKKIEHWIFWIITDVISVPLYIYKGLIFTSFQFLVFTIIAVMGYFAWERKLNG